MQPIAVTHRRVSEARVVPSMSPRKRRAQMQIARHGLAKAELPIVRHRVRPRRTTATIGRLIPIPTTAALTSRLSARSAMRPRTTIIVDLLSRALTVRHLHARTRRREPIPRQAAAIRLRRAPTQHLATLHLAAVIAVAAAIAAAVRAVVEIAAEEVEAALTVEVEAGARTVAVEAEAAHTLAAEAAGSLTAKTQLSTFCPPGIFGRAFAFTFSPPASSLPSPASPAPSFAP